MLDIPQQNLLKYGFSGIEEELALIRTSRMGVSHNFKEMVLDLACVKAHSKLHERSIRLGVQYCLI